MTESDHGLSRNSVLQQAATRFRQPWIVTDAPLGRFRSYGELVVQHLSSLLGVDWKCAPCRGMSDGEGQEEARNGAWASGVVSPGNQSIWLVIVNLS
jgi:hypothetical protein